MSRQASVAVASGLAANLWDANADLAQATLKHRFVRGLEDGSLPRASFQRFIVQDAFFLEAFARAYALALARCPDRHGLHEFASLLAGALEELSLHAAYCARWGLDSTAVEPTRATLEYTEFLLATAALRDIGHTGAAMTPCMRLYAYLGQALSRAGGATPSNPYAEWVQTYAAPEFAALAARLEGLLERYAVDSSVLRQTYRRAMQLELAFFEAAAP